MSDTNTTSLARSKESSFGVLPASPQFTLVRQTSESLKHMKETVLSAEIRADRQKSDLAQTGASADGSLNFELSAQEYLELFQGALCTTPTVINLTTAGSATITASTQVLATTAGVFTSVPIGGWIKVAGSATPANNGIKLVVAKAGNGSTLTFATGSFTANDTAAITLTMTDYRVGTEKHSWTLERGVLNSEGTDRYFQRFIGMMVNQMDLSVANKAIVTGSFSFLGRRGEVGDVTSDTGGIAVTVGSSTATHITFTVAAHAFVAGDKVSTEGFVPVAYNGEFTVTSVTGTTIVVLSSLNPAAATVFGTIRLATPAAYTAATTDPVMVGSCSTGAIFRAGALTTEFFRTVNFTIANNLRGKEKLFDCGNYDVGLGTCQVTGRLEAYFRDNTLLNDFINHTYASLAFYLTDTNGKTLGFSFPRTNFSAGESPATGENADVMVNLDWTAILDPVSGNQAIISYMA